MAGSGDWSIKPILPASNSPTAASPLWPPSTPDLDGIPPQKPPFQKISNEIPCSKAAVACDVSPVIKVSLGAGLKIIFDKEGRQAPI